jgi:hypothetical protein
MPSAFSPARPAPRLRAAIVILALASGCNGHQIGTAMGAGVSTGVGVATATAVAVAASAGSRALGGCYAICQQGEICNARTGLCDVLPCHGLCAAGEKCDEGFFGDKCVQGDGLSATSKPAAAPGSTGAIRIEDKPPVPDAARP